MLYLKDGENVGKSDKVWINVFPADDSDRSYMWKMEEDAVFRNEKNKNQQYLRDLREIKKRRPKGIGVLQTI